MMWRTIETAWIVAVCVVCWVLLLTPVGAG